MEKKNFFRVTKVEIGEYGASTDRIALDLDSIETCQKLIQLVKLQDWEIVAHTYTDERSWPNEEVVLRSGVYQDLLNREAERRADWLESQNRKVERINKLPKSFKSAVTIPAIPGLKFEYERTEATFDPRVSKTINWSLTLKVIIPGKDDKNLYLSNFTSEDGKAMTKRFGEVTGSIFGRENVHHVDPKILKELIKEYKNIQNVIAM